jgi:bacterial/archaeal transporter family-2 protein
VSFLYYFFAFLTGLANSTQSGVNSQLRQGLQNPLLAAIGSFAIGFTALILMQFAVGSPAPSLDTIRQISWWKWTGGLLGAFYVMTVIITVPKIGPANMLSLSVAGQLLAAVLLDHFGLLGFPLHPANVWRILGVALIIAGVVLVVRN